jgi:hypothetical protein
MQVEDKNIQIGDKTNLGIVDDSRLMPFGMQYKVCDEWYHHSIVEKCEPSDQQKFDNIVKSLKKERGEGLITLYHGTDKNSAQKIKDSSAFGHDGISFLTNSHSEAKEYAEMKSKYRGFDDSGEVLKIKLPKWSVRKNTGTGEYETDFIFENKGDDWMPTMNSVFEYYQKNIETKNQNAMKTEKTDMETQISHNDQKLSPVLKLKKNDSEFYDIHEKLRAERQKKIQFSPEELKFLASGKAIAIGGMKEPPRFKDIVHETIVIGDKELTIEQKRELAYNEILEVPDVLSPKKRITDAIVVLNSYDGDMNKLPNDRCSLMIEYIPRSKKRALDMAEKPQVDVKSEKKDTISTTTQNTKKRKRIGVS